jgi:hypothetical protein
MAPIAIPTPNEIIEAATTSPVDGPDDCCTYTVCGLYCGTYTTCGFAG